jgi:tetratricopeptide (TPR) repeat protein
MRWPFARKTPLGIADVFQAPEWQLLTSSAIELRHAGDITGAIVELTHAIELMMPNPKLAQETASKLNYLAVLYLTLGADDEAEAALRESIELSRPRFPLLLAANLWILGGMQSRQGMRDEAMASAEASRRLCQEHGHPHGVLQADKLLEQIQTTDGSNACNS